MSSKAADFSELFGSEYYSDINLLLYEEAEEDSRSPQQAGREPCGAEEVLPGHKLVLRALSPYFKAQIDNWSQQQEAAGSSAADGAGRSSKAARTGTHQDAAAAAAAAAAAPAAAGEQQQPSKPQITLAVPNGQLSVGHLLIKSMYEAEPELTPVEQAQLVQLIVLADRYQVLKVAAAAAEAIRALPTEQLQWETVFSAYRIPIGFAATEAYNQLYAAAALKVQEELRDLECAWNNEEKQQALVQLPFTLLKLLLADPQTRVASEDTVLYTLERWCAWQQQHMPPAQQPTDAQLRQLLGYVHMSFCSQVYVASIFAAGVVWSWRRQSCSPAAALRKAVG